MLAACIRILALLSIAALLSGAQCSLACAAGLCPSAAASSSACHHHPSPQKSTPLCRQQHVAFTTPQSAFAQAIAVHATPILPAAPPTFAPPPGRSPLALDTGSPPAPSAALRISVLRL